MRFVSKQFVKKPSIHGTKKTRMKMEMEKTLQKYVQQICRMVKKYIKFNYICAIFNTFHFPS